MYGTFKTYEEMPCSLKFEEMQELHRSILDNISGDEDAQELYAELVGKANTYASIRAGWPLLSREEKQDTDRRRTACHNSLITHFNMLARYLKKTGRDAEWRDRLGYEEDDLCNRKRIGDFACYLAFVNGINAR